MSGECHVTQTEKESGTKNDERTERREMGAGSWELGAGGWGLGKE